MVVCLFTMEPLQFNCFHDGGFFRGFAHNNTAFFVVQSQMAGSLFTPILITHNHLPLAVRFYNTVYSFSPVYPCYISSR